MSHGLKLFLLLLVFFCGFHLHGQEIDTHQSSLKFSGDFQFRAEHDWKSKRPDGSLRDDRSRLRYRLRLGIKYNLNHHHSFGARLRTGKANDPQSAHLTLGGNTNEFGTASIALDKLYYQYTSENFTIWAGKNNLLMKKSNELFWNNNVTPEGINLQFSQNLSSSSSMQFVAGHFITRSASQSFSQDSYIQVLQVSANFWNSKLSIYPSIYRFNNIGNLPGGKQRFNLDYQILHFGASYKLLPQSNVSLHMDYYFNLADYSTQDSIPTILKDEKEGFGFSINYGDLKEKGRWLVRLSYARIEKYSVVDYFAQNDWARWSYGDVGSPAARLSNFHGVEFRLGYAFFENLNILMRTYFVEQLVKSGLEKETGNRIRLDFTIDF